MSRIRWVPTIGAHCSAVADKMREADRRECLAAGLTERKAIWRSYKASLFSRTFFVNDEIAAICGMGGSFLSDVGEPWLITTPVVERVPVAFVKEARDLVLWMLDLKPKLSGVVHADYIRACRLLEVLGFTLGEPQKMGSKGAMFRAYTMERQ